MQPPSQHSRIKLAELRRVQIVRKLGPDRTSVQSKYRKDRLINDDGGEVSAERFPILHLAFRFGLPVKVEYTGHCLWDSIALVGSRSGHEQADQKTRKHQDLLNLINSPWRFGPPCVIIHLPCCKRSRVQEDDCFKRLRVGQKLNSVTPQPSQSHMSTIAKGIKRMIASQHSKKLRSLALRSTKVLFFCDQAALDRVVNLWQMQAKCYGRPEPWETAYFMFWVHMVKIAGAVLVLTKEKSPLRNYTVYSELEDQTLEDDLQTLKQYRTRSNAPPPFRQDKVHEGKTGPKKTPARKEMKIKSLKLSVTDDEFDVLKPAESAGVSPE
ncbi:hypothetical protein POM88_051554 [Heracleum sosnowskyi]|uniref:Uncharacterized protein n=1 Tax=Heracleum sosnowskyi TaxID=360622 RepID=A0AAD8H0V6_9APIA|nr:hypothetical protein POM88_051554 [Heracleum sosnowskyi]